MVTRVLLIWLLTAGLVRADWPFPSAAGTGWQYALTREPGSNTAAFSRKILSVEDGADARTISVESAADGRVESVESLKLEGDAVLATSRSDQGKVTTFDSPVLIVPSKLEAGTTCGGDEEIAGIPVAIPLTIVGEEEVKVPAGSFRAWRIHGEDRKTMTIAADRWFVPGVGSVKESVTERSPSGELLVRNTLELTGAPSAPGEGSSLSNAQPKQLEASVSTSRNGDPLNTISADALQIVARWRVHGMSDKTKIRAVWTAEDVGDVVPPEYKVDEATTMTTSPEATGIFTLERPDDGWAPGRYRVEFYVGNVLAEKIELTIAPNNSVVRDSPFNTNMGDPR